MKLYIVLFLTAWMSWGCGVVDAVDSVNETPKKMDQMRDRMDSMNEELVATGDMLHKQVLVAALESMLDEHNTQDPSNPGKMTPGGEAFAKEATPEEIIKLTYVWLKDINGSTVTEKDYIEAGEGEAAENLAKIRVNHNKYVHFQGLQVIAGLTSQEKIDKIVFDQIVNQGRYESTAYELMVLRAAFTKGYLLTQGVLKGKVINLGMTEEAMKRLGALHFLKTHALKDRFRLKISGFLPAKDRHGYEIDYPNADVSLDDMVSNEEMFKMNQQVYTEAQAEVNRTSLKPADVESLDKHIQQAKKLADHYSQMMSLN